MRKILQLSILATLTFSAFSCFPLKKPANTGPLILPLTDTVTLRKGTLVYSLPRTVFTVVADFERIIEIPGPYSQFAGDLLGLERVIRTENEMWSVKRISVHSHEEADPSEYYVIRTNSFFQTNILSMKKEGLIVDLNTGLTDNGKSSMTGIDLEPGQFQSFDLGSDEYFQVQSDTAYRRVSLDSTFVRIPYIVEKKKKLTTAQLAERAARRLMDLRDGKILILTGEANVFPQSEAAINEINKLEKEYTELFTGKRIIENRRFTYQVVPTIEALGKQVILFRFSELTGPADASSKTGSPVSLELVPEQKTKELLVLQPEINESSVHESDNIFYRTPDVVNLKIRIGSELLYSSRRLVYQYGPTLQFPGNYLIGK